MNDGSLKINEESTEKLLKQTLFKTLKQISLEEYVAMFQRLHELHIC